MTRVLLGSKCVNVKKISDFMYAFADEMEPSINAIVQAAGFVDVAAMGQVSTIAPSHHRRSRKLRPKPSPYSVTAWIRSTLTSRWTLLCSRSSVTRITSASRVSSHQWSTLVTHGPPTWPGKWRSDTGFS